MVYGAANAILPIAVIALAPGLMSGDGATAYISLCQGQDVSRADFAGRGRTQGRHQKFCPAQPCRYGSRLCGDRTWFHR